MITIVRNTKIDFLGKRYFAFALSAMLVILGLYALYAVGTGEANLGIDFAGGTAVQLKFEKPFDLQELRSVLNKGGVKDVDLQDFPTVNKVLIRVKSSEEELGEISEGIIKAIETGFPENPFVIDSTTEIGPKVGKRLKSDAFWAVVIATILILVYIAWRFQFKFGVGATMATFHDVLTVLGLFFIMGKEINLIFISALLTIAGYSLTDTVVVFDRIRENMKRSGKSTMMEVMNASVNEVLSRTLVTSITTLLAAGTLFLFGGEVIHDFSLAMIIGVLVGTYSSVFVASPIVLEWEKRVLKQ